MESIKNFLIYQIPEDLRPRYIEWLEDPSFDLDDGWSDVRDLSKEDEMLARALEEVQRLSSVFEKAALYDKLAGVIQEML